MKRYILVLFVLFCFSPTGHAQVAEPPHTIDLDRRAEQLVWSPDSRYIAFLAIDEDYDTNVQVIEVSTGQLIADFDYSPTVIAWSPDSTRVAVTAGKDTGKPEFPSMTRDVPITILDVETGDETTIGSDTNVNGLGWSPDGTRLAVTTSMYITSDMYETQVKIWDVATGAAEDLINDGYGGVDSYFYAPVWSPDGTRLAIPNANGSITIWDVEHQEEVFNAWSFPRTAYGLAWSPSGGRIAAAGPGSIRTWDVATGEPLLAMRASVSELRWIDDNQLAVVGQDNISFVDPVSGQVGRALETGLDLQPDSGRWKSYIVWSPDGQYAALADNHNIGILSLIGMSPVASPPVALTLADPVAPLSTLPVAAKRVSTANVGQLALLGQLGRDTIRDTLWSPDGSTIALLGTHGVWLYDDPSLSQSPHLLDIANGTVNAMLFSPDSRYLVLAVKNETNHDFGVRFWDLQSDTVVRVLKGHTGQVTAMDFSADGRLLATGSADLTIRLWNVETGEQVRVLWAHVDTVLSVDFSPDSHFLVSAGDSMMRLWDVETGNLLGSGNGDWGYYKQIPRVVNAQFTPHGKAVFYFYLNLNGENVFLRTWTLSSDTHWDLGIAPFGMSGFVGAGRQYELAFSPDGTKMIPYTRYGSWLSMLDINTREETKQWWVLSCVISSGAVAFSPDGSELAIGVTRNQACDPFPQNEPKTIWLLNLQTGERRAVLRAQVAPVNRLIYSPDGSRLLAVSTDNTIRMWDVAAAEELQVLTDFRNPASHLAFDPTGALTSLEIARDAIVMRRNGQPMRGEYGGEFYGGNSPIDGITANRDFSVVIAIYRGFSLIFPDEFVKISVWNPETVEYPLMYSREMHQLQSVAVNQSGALLASSQGGVVKLWNIDTETEHTILMNDPTLRVSSLAFSPDDRLLAGVISPPGNAVTFWELSTGTQRSIVLPDPDANITALTFSSDSRYVAAQTGEADVWILPLQANADPIVLHTDAENIRYVAFSQDSALIALATDDAIQLWDCASGTPIVSLAASSVTLAFNNDDTLLASGESDGTVKLWGIR